jgi:hypothetical protein
METNVKVLNDLFLELKKINLKLDSFEKLKKEFEEFKNYFKETPTKKDLELFELIKESDKLGIWTSREEFENEFKVKI